MHRFDGDRVAMARVAEQRVADRCEVGADLVGAAGSSRTRTSVPSFLRSTTVMRDTERWPLPSTTVFGRSPRDSAAGLVGNAASVQGGLFATAVKKRDQLLAAMDASSDRHGEDAVRHGGEKRRTDPWGADGE